MATNNLLDLRSRYAGRIFAERRGRQADEMARTARALMREWNPVLASEDDLRALMGRPSRVRVNALEYVFDNGFGGERWRFGIRGGFVVSVEWDGLD